MSDINKLLEEIKSIDLENLKNMTDEQKKIMSDKIHNLRKKTNPYASNIERADGSAAQQLLFMFTPVYRDYLAKFMMTSTLAYLNRACDEWGVPDGVPVVPVYDYIQNESLIDDPKPVNNETNAVDEVLLEDYAKNRKLMEKRLVVKEFLEYMFQYDPDEHVRSAYSPNMKDPERKLIVTPASRMGIYMEKRRIENKRKSTKEEKKEAKKLLDDFDEAVKKANVEQKKEYIKEVTQKITSKNGKGTMLVRRKIKCTKDEYELYIKQRAMYKDSKGFLLKERKIDTYKDDFIEEPNMVKFMRMQDITLHDTVRNMLPPADLFHRFLYYMDSNYEALMNAVKDIYSEKPDVDWAINPLKVVRNVQEARKYRRKHEGEINWPILSVNTNNWSLFGPYKNNRDRLDFYGSNMSLFEEMFKKNEKDRELGAQIMMKRKRKKRKQQEKRVGKLHENIKPGFNPVTNVANYNTIDENENEDKEHDNDVMMSVIRLRDGGRITETTEFATEYVADSHVIK